MKNYFVMTAQEYALYLTGELEYIERSGSIYRVSPAPGNEERAVPGLGVLAGLATDEMAEPRCRFYLVAESMACAASESPSHDFWNKAKAAGSDMSKGRWNSSCSDSISGQTSTWVPVSSVLVNFTHSAGI